MKYEIVNIEESETILTGQIVTLYQTPNALEKMLGKQEGQIQFQGTKDAWFVLPSFDRCNAAMEKLLNDYCKKYVR